MTYEPYWDDNPDVPIQDPTQPAGPEPDEDLDDDQADGSGSHADPTGEDDLPPLHFGSVDEFVRDFVRHVFRRNVGEPGRAEHRWSARWWESAEAVIRLEAMWRTWEHHRLDPATGISTWLRDHADYHLAVLMSPDGPFAQSRDTAGVTDPLPYEPPPPELFPDVRKQRDT